ncbi:hypothetical protein T459_25009 [Capsicum annuum]|uniref:Uncharacterized protein n=1 Tax=Capsicum annuum TaxID=4072 RepID=A0A2G2YJL8_CAPAN|nr:hypothetical protein T459_25009 [Capsicum annuum]
MVSKKDMELNNARDDVGDKGWAMFSLKQSVSPQISKELNVAKKQCIATKDVVDPTTFEALLDKNEHQSDSGSPKCQIALPEPLMAKLDASTCEIPSPSMESIGEQRDNFRHKLLFKGNEQDVDGVVVLTPTRSNNKVEAKSGQKSGTNIKSWADMAEEEKQASSPLTCSKLSPATSEFMPSYAMVLPSLATEQLVAQTNPMEAFEGDLGVGIFDEEDEDEVLDECVAKVARDEDFSPRQQSKGFKKKKIHERKLSWDGKVPEEAILRQLPMRVAKQKETRFNYINKIQ